MTALAIEFPSAEEAVTELAQPVRTGETLTLEVCRADRAADGVRRVVLRDPDGRRLPDWTPGAHIDVVLPGQQIRQYSLCGDRADAFTYQIKVLREPAGRGGSAYIHDRLTVGDRIEIGGPRNNFVMVPGSRYLFIAGGIGITPLMAMIEAAETLGIDWSLLYGGRSVQSMAFVTELAKFGERVCIWPQDHRGLLPLAATLDGEPPETKVYCCGPAPLLTAVEEACANRPAGNLRIERFAVEELPAPVRADAFEVYLQRSDKTVVVPPGRPMLDVINDAGVPLVGSCRQGVCGTCMTAVADGLPDHRDSLLTAAERASNDCILPCVSRACSDRLVLDL